MSDVAIFFDKTTGKLIRTEPAELKEKLTWVTDTTAIIPNQLFDTKTRSLVAVQIRFT